MYESEVWEGNKNQAGCGSLGVLIRTAIRQLEVNKQTSLSIFAPSFLEEETFFLLSSVYYKQQFYTSLEGLYNHVKHIYAWQLIRAKP